MVIVGLKYLKVSLQNLLVILKEASITSQIDHRSELFPF